MADWGKLLLLIIHAAAKFESPQEYNEFAGNKYAE